MRLLPLLALVLLAACAKSPPPGPDPALLAPHEWDHGPPWGPEELPWVPPPPVYAGPPFWGYGGWAGGGVWAGRGYWWRGGGYSHTGGHRGRVAIGGRRGRR